MITEDYVSFETAKFLKEKGFNEYCKSVYHVGSLCSVASLGYHDNESYGAVIEEKQNSDFGKYDNAISAPTLQMAMRWLREEKKLSIIIEICFDYDRDREPGYFFDIWQLTPPYESQDTSVLVYDTYEQACEAAIKYCLENLI